MGEQWQHALTLVGMRYNHLARATASALGWESSDSVVMQVYLQVVAPITECRALVNGHDIHRVKVDINFSHCCGAGNKTEHDHICMHSHTSSVYLRFED